MHVNISCRLRSCVIHCKPNCHSGMWEFLFHVCVVSEFILTILSAYIVVVVVVVVVAIANNIHWHQQKLGSRQMHCMLHWPRIRQPRNETPAQVFGSDVECWTLATFYTAVHNRNSVRINNNNNNVHLLNCSQTAQSHSTNIRHAGRGTTATTQGSTMYRRVKPAKLLPHAAHSDWINHTGLTSW